MSLILHKSPKVNNNVFIFVGLTTLCTLVISDWLIDYVKCSNLSTNPPVPRSILPKTFPEIWTMIRHLLS